MTAIKYPFTVPALKVEQPIGTFFVAVLPAELLLQVANSDRAEAHLNADGIGYHLTGNQRLIQDKRLSQIADYINREDATFPNSLILAANYDPETGYDTNETEDLSSGETDLDASESELSWYVSNNNGSWELTIPSDKKLAAIVDGQHRLFAFTEADAANRLDMNLICSVFLDLPKSMQAQIFATINTTQKAVDRSLTYELFGYNVQDEPSEYWTPDKLAVFLTRKLATEKDSPLRGKIAVAPKKDSDLQNMQGNRGWKVSTAVVVDGIMRLISSNPKKDSNHMRTGGSHKREVLRDYRRDKTILREEFVSNNDQLIFTAVKNYLLACDSLFWQKAKEDSFIIRTAGIMALFDLLRLLLPEALTQKDIRQAYFENVLTPAASIDFSEEQFRKTSGSGRTFIRKTIEATLGAG